jgi:gluconate 2-dehydrogenase gamma chain
MGERTYLGEPFASGTPTQGYQMHAPAVAYREAIASVNAYARQIGGANFAQLSGDAQDRILHDLESGHAQLAGSVAAKPFFDLLWQNTIEGYFADPIYGGNRRMGGWRLIGFPGAHYDYRPQLPHMHERLDLEPVGLMPVRR